MSPLQTLGCQLDPPFAGPALAQPTPSLLGAMISSRLKADQDGPAGGPLPAGVYTDLRPVLPKVGLKALGLYINRRAVQSLALIYSALALAHPN